MVCVESNWTDGQTDSHRGYSAQLWVVQSFDIKSLNIVVIDNFDLYIFQFNIEYVIFWQFFHVSNSPRSLVTILHTCGWTMIDMNKYAKFDPNIPCGSRVLSIFTN